MRLVHKLEGKIYTIVVVTLDHQITTDQKLIQRALKDHPDLLTESWDNHARKYGVYVFDKRGLVGPVEYFNDRYTALNAAELRYGKYDKPSGLMTPLTLTPTSKLGIYDTMEDPVLHAWWSDK